MMVLGGLLLAVMLAGCSPTGPNSALQSARRACAVIEGSQWYPVVPPSGIYVGIDTATRVAKAIQQSGDPKLQAELPALRRAIKMLAEASDGTIAANGERLIQKLTSEPQNYCTTIGIPPAT
jgi:hypothetical protein